MIPTTCEYKLSSAYFNLGGGFTYLLIQIPKYSLCLFMLRLGIPTEILIHLLVWTFKLKTDKTRSGC